MIQVVFFVFFSGVAFTRSFEPYHVPLGSVWGYFTPPVLKTPQRVQTPMEAMVDLTNSLGVSILQDHSYSRGNFAFSPYGVASVLVVMYEGAVGESAHQIRRAVGFPSDKDVLRMGFRDIHRHLRNYFSHEGFLSGISLNKNGSNLKPGFKKLLKYYGYDVDLNLHLDDESKVEKPSTEKTEPTKSEVTTIPQPNNEKPTTEGINEEMDTKNKTDNSEVKKPEESIATEKEDGNEIHTTTLPTTKEASIRNGSESTESNLIEKEVSQTTLTTTVKETMPVSEEEYGNDAQTTTLPYSTTEDESESKEPATVNLKDERVPPTTESIAVTTDQTTMVTSEPTTESNTEEGTTTKLLAREEMKRLTAVFPDENEKNSPEFDNEENKFQKSLKSNEKEVKCKKDANKPEREAENEILCDLKQDKSTTGQETLVKARFPENKTESEGMKLDNGMLIPQSSEESTDAEKTTPGSTFLHFATEANGSQQRPGQISSEESSDRKSSVKSANAMSRVLKPNRDNWDKELRKMFDSKTSIWGYERPKKLKSLHAGRGRRTIADYLKLPANPALSVQLQNGMYVTQVSRNAETYRSLPRLMFLVDGAIDTPVPMMSHTNVFSYAYLPKLHAKALEFPLDDVRYKLLIVLPVERRGLRQLIYDFGDISVREVLTCLRPTRVKAVIPTFMVEGFVILTSSLQRLGIRDVFDPRKANLSGMSVDPELFVRNVEQSVTVVIKNYVEIFDIQTRTTAARYLEHEFEATHPFVYFVLDTATNVALMVGQMLDPLNSRVY